MHIDDDIRKLLVEPTLNGSLAVPVDEFVLHSPEGPIPLAATLRIDGREHAFHIEVRDTEGRDLRQFFTSSNKVSESDTLSASGTIGGRVRVAFRRIWPPSHSQTRPIGDVRTSTAILKPEVIDFPPSTADARSTAETWELLQKLNPHRPQPVLSEEDSALTRFEHVAIFANVKLQFMNAGSEWKEAHSFWGERSGSKSNSWDGSALDGEYSIRQSGGHLEVGFRHEGDDDEEAKLRFDALLDTICYTHAIFPWPTFVHRRRDGRVMDQKLRIANQVQGDFFPLRDRDGHLTPSAPSDLIASVSRFMANLGSDERATLREALWVFRGADTELAPAPLKMAMICSVIEGIRTELFRNEKPPGAFSELQKEAIGWLDGLEAAESITPERNGYIGRLKGMITRWNYCDRRVEWENAFLQLFPTRREWVMELFRLFNRFRHGPAHGSYGSITKGDPHDVLEATGKLAGFANIVIAARAGYKGPILDSPFGDRRISL